jgi:hypothetical protein
VPGKVREIATARKVDSVLYHSLIGLASGERLWSHWSEGRLIGMGGGPQSPASASKHSNSRTDPATVTGDVRLSDCTSFKEDW